MKAISRVLCAVDIDEPGRAAFAQALALARAHAAKIIIVYAVPIEQTFNSGATERLAYLQELRAAAEAVEVDVQVDVQHGEAAEVILLHARVRQPDLIVLSAAHGIGANTHPTSSLVEDVLRGATCPTLIVRGDRVSTPVGALRNVLCAVDFSPSSVAAFERAWCLAASLDCSLTLLHVMRSRGAAFRSKRVQAESYRYQVEAAFQKLQALIPLTDGAAVLARVTIGRVAHEILRAARASQADLVVVGAQPRSRLGRRLFGITRRLLQEAPCPVLAVPARASETRETRRTASNDVSAKSSSTDVPRSVTPGASRPQPTYARFAEREGTHAATA